MECRYRSTLEREHVSRFCQKATRRAPALALGSTSFVRVGQAQAGPRRGCRVVCEGVSAVMKSAALERLLDRGFHSRWVERLRGRKPARTVEFPRVSGNLRVSWLDNTASS